MKATHEDATLLVQLAQLGATRDIDAADWLNSERFDPDYETFVAANPPGSEGFRTTVRIAQHYELIGSLWKHGLLNEELLFDTYLVTLLWDRMKGFVLGQREQLGEPRLGENFEALAEAQRAWAAAGRS